MTFDWHVSVGDIIALGSLGGSIIMFILTAIKQSKSKDSADKANSFYDAAKKYYDLMTELPKVENAHKNDEVYQKAICDASIVNVGSSKWVLKVYNKGKSIAKNITFNFTEEESPLVLSNDMFPIKVLEQHDNVDLPLIVSLGTRSSSWEYEVKWENEDGTMDSKIGYLTLPLT